MTYWPISSPSVFAATKDTRPVHVQTSHDGVEHGATDNTTESSAADSEERTESEISEKEESRIDIKAAEKQLELTPDEQLAEDDVSGEILAIQVTRSGHMFATITRSTLTIWQTKAWL